jgi:AcrR family transcriptional regulator
MTTLEPFQRARRPEQKEGRRLHLLETAKAALHGGLEVSDLGLNELARRAQMTKSNVYRYFENREALLLALLEEESALWQNELSLRLDASPYEKSEKIATAFASACAAYPLMCRLFSILPSIIESNVSSERLTEFKLQSLASAAGVAVRLHQSAPELSVGTYAEFMRMAIALLIGLWPLSHPGEALADVLSRPELKPLRYEFEADFAAGLLLLLKGLEPD